jgi:hypothetical protein
MKSISVFVLILGLTGCASIFHKGAGREPLRLCIRNSTVGYGNLVAHAGLTRFDVMPGREECKQIAEITSTLTLTAQTTGGGVAGPLSYSTNVPGSGERCWRWELGNSRATQVNLMPCELSEPPGDSATSSGG